MRNCNLLRLLTLSGFLSLAVLPRHAAAQWPTLDISSVKEGISTNIELVKQSKVVTDAMATAGKINAGIGDAKASVSKFAGDNLAKAQEKMKKLQEEKERIEKKKEEYEKIKKEIEEKKEAMEDYKRQAEALKADAEGYIADAKEMKDAASDVVSTVKDDVSSASSSAGISSGNADLNTTSAVAEAEPQTAVSGRTAFGSAQSESGYQVAAPTSDAKNYGEAVSETSAVAGISEVAEDDTAEADVQALAEEQLKLKEEQEALDKEKAELEVDAMFAKTPEEKAAVEEKMKALDAKYEDLNGRMSENAAQLAAAQEQTAAEAAVETPAENKAVPAGRRPFGMPEKAAAVTNENNDDKQPVDEKEKDEDKEPQPFHRAKILDGETSTKMEIPESHRAKILDTYEAPVDHTPKILEQSRQQSGNSSGGFRKRAVQRSSALQNGRHYASRSFSETMVFADLAGGSVPDGTVNGVFILSDRLAQECEINVADLEDEKVMDECIKKLVKAKSDNDASIAQEATAVYKTIMQETVNGLIAESMAQKNEAANYETKVLEEMEKKIAQTKNSRDDTGGLSLTNMETQYLLNRILTIYAGQLTLDTLNEVSGFDKSYYQDGDDEETGEEK
ncbi:MAG: hypothetical protein EGQ57_06110 [Alphaproteobacteria bacterium]|nr:hypothetical protein [Alphaproteobacteria bacterium]